MDVAYFSESFDEFCARTQILARADMTRAEAKRRWSSLLDAAYADWKTRPAPPNMHDRRQTFPDTYP